MKRQKRIRTTLGVEIKTQPITHTDLTARAFASLRNFLTHKANSNPTEAQLKVLYALMDNLSRLAFKETTGRFAWALPVGCGKTQSTMHWCAKMLEAKLDFGVAIACGQVSALNDINDFLVHHLHVPQDLVGTVNDHLKFPLVRSSEIPPLPVMNDVLRGAPEIGPPRDRLS